MLMMNDLNRVATEFVKQTGRKPKTLTVGVVEANEIIHLAFECHPNCDYRFGFDAVKHCFDLDSIEIVCKQSKIQFA